MKRISTDAYQALRDAIPVITWNKRPFETFLRTALRDNTELLGGLNFSEPKRMVADQLVDLLVTHEERYQEVTLRLMLEVSSITRFQNIEQIKDADDRAQRLQEARTAVGRLKEVTKQYSSALEESEVRRAELEATRLQAEALRKFDSDLDELRQRFIGLQPSGTDPHKRGYALESLLADLFLLFDMEPRLAYSLEREQIDGSFSFDTDDYILEARWRAELADRGDGDIFHAKVQRKGKNALGLFISINGFKQTLIDQYSEATSFITMDGADLYAVLDKRLRLDDLIRAKRRHANDTGSCHLPAIQLL